MYIFYAGCTINSLKKKTKMMKRTLFMLKAVIVLEDAKILIVFMWMG